MALLNMRNNIVDNRSTPVLGAGFIRHVYAAVPQLPIMVPGTITSSIRGDTAATNRYIYADGTNNYSSLSAYQTATLRDALSILTANCKQTPPHRMTFICAQTLTVRSMGRK